MADAMDVVACDAAPESAQRHGTLAWYVAKHATHLDVEYAAALTHMPVNEPLDIEMEGRYVPGSDDLVLDSTWPVEFSEVAYVLPNAVYEGPGASWTGVRKEGDLSGGRNVTTAVVHGGHKYEMPPHTFTITPKGTVILTIRRVPIQSVAATPKRQNITPSLACDDVLLKNAAAAFLDTTRARFEWLARERRGDPALTFSLRRKHIVNERDYDPDARTKEKLQLKPVEVNAPDPTAAIGWEAAEGQPVPKEVSIVVKFDETLASVEFRRALLESIKPGKTERDFAPDMSQLYKVPEDPTKLPFRGTVDSSTGCERIVKELRTRLAMWNAMDNQDVPQPRVRDRTVRPLFRHGKDPPPGGGQFSGQIVHGFYVAVTRDTSEGACWGGKQCPLLFVQIGLFHTDYDDEDKRRFLHEQTNSDTMTNDDGTKSNAPLASAKEALKLNEKAKLPAFKKSPFDVTRYIRIVLARSPDASDAPEWPGCIWTDANGRPYADFKPWRNPLVSRARELCGTNGTSKSSPLEQTPVTVVADDVLKLLWARDTSVAIERLQQLAPSGQHRDALALLAIYERAGMKGEIGAGAPVGSAILELYAAKSGLLQTALTDACDRLKDSLYIPGDPDAGRWFDTFRLARATDGAVWKTSDEKAAAARVRITVEPVSSTLKDRSHDAAYLTPERYEDYKRGIQHGLARLLCDPDDYGMYKVERWPQKT